MEAELEELREKLS